MRMQKVEDLSDEKIDHGKKVEERGKEEKETIPSSS